jgi:hypothetical protein
MTDSLLSGLNPTVRLTSERLTGDNRSNVEWNWTTEGM